MSNRISWFSFCSSCCKMPNYYKTQKKFSPKSVLSSSVQQKKKNNNNNIQNEILALLMSFEPLPPGKIIILLKQISSGNENIIITLFFLLKTIFTILLVFIHCFIQTTTYLECLRIQRRVRITLNKIIDELKKCAKDSIKPWCAPSSQRITD